MIYETVNLKSKMAIIGILLGIGLGFIFMGGYSAIIGSFIIGFSISKLSKYL